MVFNRKVVAVVTADEAEGGEEEGVLRKILE
jgi:hypothetical protein